MKWGEIFDVYAAKTVTWTDKNKNSYVLTKEQLAVLKKGGLVPTRDKVFLLPVLNNEHTVGASFYLAERSSAADRVPEARMGREFIRSWLEVGEQVVFGIAGGQLFVVKPDVEAPTEEDMHARIAAKAKPGTIKKLAEAAVGKPKKRTVTQEVFVRNLYVVAEALRRANDCCETPGCNADLFTTDGGREYLEVHHITPLAEGGDDTLANTAALCPSCHRELHRGTQRLTRRNLLSAYRQANP